MIALNDHLSIGMLIRTFWGRITITWGLTLIETALFALMPLMIGRSIDGLLNDDWAPFTHLIIVLGVLLLVATGRRVYDTRPMARCGSNWAKRRHSAVRAIPSVS